MLNLDHYIDFYLTDQRSVLGSNSIGKIFQKELMVNQWGLVSQESNEKDLLENPGE